jgi:hypothetical protein
VRSISRLETLSNISGMQTGFDEFSCVSEAETVLRSYSLAGASDFLRFLPLASESPAGQYRMGDDVPLDTGCSASISVSFVPRLRHL